MLVLPASADVISGLVEAADEAPEDLSIIAKIMKAPPLPFIPREQHGKPVVMARMVYTGEPAAGEKAITPIRTLATPLADMIRPMRYREMYDEPASPAPAFSLGTNLLLDALSMDGVETILAHLETATAPVTVVELRVLGGAMARIPDEATAFAHRQAKFMVNISTMDHRVDKRLEHEAWAFSMADALSAGVAKPAYVGFLGDEGEGGVRRAYPPATLKRLAQVKRQYDPDNLFHLNLNVAPDTTQGERRV
jgi:berberine-like enzyme